MQHEVLGYPLYLYIFCFHLSQSPFSLILADKLGEIAVLKQMLKEIKRRRVFGVVN